MRHLSRQLAAVKPEQTSSVFRLCALCPAESVNLVQQLLRWERWAHGDVVALGSIAHPRGVAWTAGSLIPFGVGARAEHNYAGATPAQIHALAAQARQRLTAYGSIFGATDDVAPIWQVLAGAGWQAREERWEQPHLLAPFPAGGLANSALRSPQLAWVASGLHAARAAEEAILLPASVAMFQEELGYDPLKSGSAYRRQVSWLVAQRRSYIVVDDGQGHPPTPGSPQAVAFKADVGALWSPLGSPGVAQITGVWTRPDQRGKGIGTVALAATVAAVRAQHTGANGTVSLYVNSFNTAARALYAALGFRQVGTFSTVLF